MLLNITIKNYALIENLNIDFDEGLNLITGETGAGKSIIIDALMMLLGYRGNKANIRHGADKILVQGLFDVSENKAVAKVLADLGIESEESLLLLSRQLDTKGKNICRAAGVMITVSQLKDIGDHLIDIHGQHEHQSLFHKENHRSLLDDFGGETTQKLLQKVGESAVALKECIKEIRRLEQSDQETERQKELYEHELQEIVEAGLEAGEEEALLAEKKILDHGEQLFLSAGEAYALLNGDENADTPGVTQGLGELLNRIDAMAAIDTKFQTYRGPVETAFSEMENLAFEIRSTLDNMDFSPAAQDRVETRLAVIAGLKRKYGQSVEAVIAYGESLADKLNGLENKNERLAEMRSQYKTLWTSYQTRAAALHENRLENGEKFKQGLEAELADLAMEKAVVVVDVTREEKVISPKGQDQIEFLISANPGIPPKPLRKIASGGEISRIMLAIKSIFGDKDRIQTMIFDEIDTGISGRTAQAVAEKILGLSKTHQIICITHLPQIAAMADRHFEVEKLADSVAVEVDFKTLDAEGRRVALAKMLGGAEVTQTTLDHAGEMLAMTKALKDKI